MANLDKETLKKLTQLSRIDCTEEEQEGLLEDLRKILTYVDQLSEIETKDVVPCNHILEDIVNVMREDRVGEILPRDVFLGNAPSQVGGMIKVPPVLKQN